MENFKKFATEAARAILYDNGKYVEDGEGGWRGRGRRRKTMRRRRMSEEFIRLGFKWKFAETI
jgi:hypothetical protein